ncbi:PTS transporter subunit IIC [Carnobacterium gallinarum]|uniref:PTS transporter subunit IIC n=1 Tax=Carnobacterium gallinarum TaxID=2749 RepID=UPI0005575E96|nr:PTS transporter subunit IIC [Carnobacterium gallinarum]
MEILKSAIEWFIGLGGTYFVPIVMLIIGLCCKAGFKVSIKSALLIGIGLTGLNMITDFSVQAMQPITQKLSEQLNADFSIVDIGYGSVTAAWSWPGVPWVILGIVVINIILVSLRLTSTLWVDMWNIWHGQALGVMFWAFTGSITLGIIVGIGTLVLSMFLADFHAKKFQEFNHLEGVTVPAPSATFPATFAFFAMKIINIIPGLNKVKASSSDIKEKFGLLGENSVIGALLGVIIGLVSRISIAEIIQLSIKLAAILVILPAMLQFVADGILPITDNLASFMRDRFKGRKLNIAVDPVLLLSDPSVMSTVIIMYPIAIFVSALLPGNNFLPVASLAALPYWIGGMAPYTKGNIVYNVILTTIWIIPTTLVATSLAGLTTGAAELTNILGDNIAAGTLVSAWDEGGNLLMWVIVKISELIGFG